MHTEDIRRGALMMVASGLIFAVMAAMIKTLSLSLPNEMIVFFRSALGLLSLLPWLWQRGWHTLKTAHLSAHLLRSLSGLTAMYCFFYAIGHLPLAEATLLNYSTPLFVPFIAWLWLKEAIPRNLLWAIGIGFLGIILILKPGLALFTPISLVGLASGIFAALAMTSIRRLTRSEPVIRIVFYFSFVSTLISCVPLLWAWRNPSASAWVLLIAVGVLATAAQLLMTRAYAHAPAAQVGPFAYSTVVFAGLIGWAYWGELLDWLSLAGALLVCFAGAWTIRHAGKRAITAAPPAEGAPPQI